MLKAAAIVENERAKAKWGMIPTKAQRAAWKLGDPRVRTNKTGRRVGGKYG
jgi:hypothetical protein